MQATALGGQDASEPAMVDVKTTGLAAFLLAIASVGGAEQPNAFGFYASLTAATDYMFRGISQTSNRPAAQGTVAVEHTNGFFCGLFASTIDFDQATDAAVEADLWLGYRMEAKQFAELEVQIVRITYPDASGQLSDFTEFHGAVGKSGWQVAVDYSPNVFGSGEGGLFLSLRRDFRIKRHLVFSALIGRYSFEKSALGPNDPWVYLYWTVAGEWSRAGWLLGFSYIDTNIAGDEMFGGGEAGLTKGRLVFSISRAWNSG